MGSSLIPLDDSSTCWRINPFVSGFTILFFNLTKSREMTPWEIKFLIDLCLTLKCLLFSLKFVLVTLDIATWLSQCTEIEGIDLFNNGKSHNKFLRNSVSLVAVSKAIIYAYMVKCEIIVCSADFHDTVPPAKVKTYLFVDFVSWEWKIQFCTTNPLNYFLIYQLRMQCQA